MIPVFIGAEEDPEAALDDSAFKPVWDVIRALRAHDADLAEQLDSLRRELGKGASSVTIPPKIHLDLPAHIGLDFASAFDVRLVEETTASWEFWLGLLEAFVEREGHCRVPQKLTSGRLQPWNLVRNDRRAERRAGTLGAERLAALDALGFVWDPLPGGLRPGPRRACRVRPRRTEMRECRGSHTTPSGFKLGHLVQSTVAPSARPAHSAPSVALRWMRLGSFGTIARRL